MRRPMDSKRISSIIQMDSQLFPFGGEESSECFDETRMSRTLGPVAARRSSRSSFRSLFRPGRSLRRGQAGQRRVRPIFPSFDASTRSVRSDETVRRSSSVELFCSFIRSFRNVRQNALLPMEKIFMDEKDLFAFLRTVQQVEKTPPNGTIRLLPSDSNDSTRRSNEGADRTIRTGSGFPNSGPIESRWVSLVTPLGGIRYSSELRHSKRLSGHDQVSRSSVSSLIGTSFSSDRFAIIISTLRTTRKMSLVLYETLISPSVRLDIYSTVKSRVIAVRRRTIASYFPEVERSSWTVTMARTANRSFITPSL